MNLDHLNYFKTLVELRSRSATAEKLSITPSTLSLALGKLEQEVGVPLIEKKRGAVELTSEGELFYEYVDASLRFFEQWIEDVGGKAVRISARDSDWHRLFSSE